MKKLKTVKKKTPKKGTTIGEKMRKNWDTAVEDKKAKRIRKKIKRKRKWNEY